MTHYVTYNSYTINSCDTAALSIEERETERNRDYSNIKKYKLSIICDGFNSSVVRQCNSPTNSVNQSEKSESVHWSDSGAVRQLVSRTKNLGQVSDSSVVRK